ncbi:MAG: hypothetical protein ACFFG0_29260 [Candidatus Thorarchaeota archaeon]
MEIEIVNHSKDMLDKLFNAISRKLEKYNRNQLKPTLLKGMSYDCPTTTHVEFTIYTDDVNSSLELVKQILKPYGYSKKPKTEYW